MGAPFSPADFKALVPAAGGSFCTKFLNVLIKLPYMVWQFVAWMFDEQGNLSQDFKTLLCTSCANVIGGGAANPNMPAPPSFNASDGTYPDKVRLTWDPSVPPVPVAAVTHYLLYRAPVGTTDPNLAALIATVDGTTYLFDDMTAAIGVTYTYFARATNDTPEGISAYTQNDGNAGAVATTLPAVTDLACTKGFSPGNDGLIALVWTTTPGAARWDIYRNTVNDPATATVIKTDGVPLSTNNSNAGPGANFLDNDGELVYRDDPHLVPGGPVYYYWVVGKKDAPPAVSPKSNSDSGWVSIAIPPFVVGGGGNVFRHFDITVPAGATKARVVLFGGNAPGAGGGQIYGSGGGGGGAVVMGEKAVVAGAKVRVVAVPDSDSTGTTPGSLSAPVGYAMTLQYSALGTFADTVTIATTTAPAGGIYNSSGGGAGGPGGSGAAPGLTAASIIPGRAGQPGAAGNGGKCGYMFGGNRLPMSNRTTGDIFAGSGSKAISGASNADAVGGQGEVGYAVIAFQ